MRDVSRFAGRQPSLLAGYVDAPADRARLQRSLTEAPPAVVLIDEQEVEALDADLPPVSAMLRGLTSNGTASAGSMMLDVWARDNHRGCS